MFFLCCEFFFLNVQPNCVVTLLKQAVAAGLQFKGFIVSTDDEEKEKRNITLCNIITQSADDGLCVERAVPEVAKVRL